jgi:FixJ family two-component response regulator
MPNRIAVIDDDTAVRESTKGLLRSLGYEACAFASAEDFLNSDEINRISCIVTDVRMPGMGGVALQARLINDGRRIPIIFITAFPEERVKEQVLAAGAGCFLVKPYQEGSLIKCIESALAA